MQVFFQILERLVPLYFLISLGFVAGRILKAQRSTIALLLIYIITPGVVFYGIVNTKLDASHFSLPLLFFGLCTSISLLFYKAAGRFMGSPTKNILALAAGTANTGYFGLPVATFLLGEEVLGLVIFAIMGFIIFENTLGFYLTAKGRHSARDSFLRVVKLPAIYAMVAAILMNLSGFRPGPLINLLGTSFRGAYTVLGMMMIGLAVGDSIRPRINLEFIGWSFLAKFVAWPSFMLGVIFLDVHLWHFFTPQIHKVMILMSAVPLAANTAAIATLLDTEPEKASMAVLASTIFALFFIPLVITFYP